MSRSLPPQAAVPTEATDVALLRSPDLLRKALPGGGAAISRLRNQGASQGADAGGRVPTKG
ncbi:MAG TPA: hypothetical protein VFL86_24995, partial [Burkholderiaceae bacterium]|nr:hypothetical protein [Burkholderiaceae bacterium]